MNVSVACEKMSRKVFEKIKQSKWGTSCKSM